MNNFQFNKEILINQLQKYYIKNNIFSILYQSDLKDDKLYKFKNLTINNLDTNKYINSLIINNDFNLLKSDTIITIFQLVKNEKSINFGFVYGNINKKTNMIDNLFIMLSLSSISKDGEYKHRLIKYKYIDEILKNPILKKVYSYIYKNFINNEFELSFSIYNLHSKKIKKEYSKLLSNNIMILKSLTIIWYIEIYMKIKNNNILFINQESFNLLCSSRDDIYYQKLFNDHKTEIINSIPFIAYYNENTRLEIGQKLLPFNYNQLKEYNHLIHFQWKELLINRIINSLIHNNISSCFSLFIDWVLITNGDKKIYNNDEIYKKINYSDQIKNILNLLYVVKSNLIKLNNQFEKNKIITKLENKLQSIINETQSNILMSNVSLCFFSEYSGKTLFNHLTLLNNNYVNPLLGNLFTNFDLFNKYIFEIIYSLYSLNLKGIIHGDLHLNNITFSLTNKIDDNSYILYDLNNNFNSNILNYINKYPNISNSSNIVNSPVSIESLSNDDLTKKNMMLNNCYIFKHNGYFPCIIDYSRSFILLKLIDTSIIEINNTKVRRKYIKNETKRIVNELNKIFPNYIKNNGHKLKFLLKNKNFNILFIYFSAYDTFTFITNLLIYMKKTNLASNIEVNPKIIELLTKISKKSYKYLEEILNEENYSSQIKHQFPNYLILKEFFSKSESTKLDLNKNITNYFSLVNINTYYSINDIKANNKLILNSYINSNKISEDNKNKIKKEFSTILNYSSNFNDELNIEKVINNEYYNIKSNLHIMTSSLNNDIDFTYDATTNSLNLSNY